ncbi:T9SS type A sorting domain-containing protein [Terrimonas rubra]|uniref:T9SS type A sorting domain-containing protein n=1 Tax=Terrimonas rubra TaxID=1035890 RepID=A0ABW6A8R1_9BACT
MKKNFILSVTVVILLVFFGPSVNGQVIGNCTANAGGNAVVCGSSTTLTGSASGNVGAFPPTWTFITGPVTPVIASPNTFTTNVTGMTAEGSYTFRLAQRCGTGTATSQVVITAHPRPASFTAGPDILNVCATTGSTPLSGVIPAGFTGAWRAVNIWRYNRAGETVSTNAQFSSTTVATPTFSLINTSNHQIDPAYWAILRITSLDGVCSYEDTTVVSFIPNPNINPPLNTSRCVSAASPSHYINLTAAPYFNTNYAGSAGASSTTISLNVLTQPAGANMSFARLDDNNFFFFNGVTQPGTYTFTITVTNSCGTYTSPTLTYTFMGLRPNPVNLQPSGHVAPEQLVIYYTTGSGGEVHCNLAGTSTPQSFYFDVDPVDPATVLTTVTPSGVLPPGGAPTVVVTGANTYNREAIVTPPAGGWRVGTYRFSISVSNPDGSCATSQLYYIHVSDQSRPKVEVADINVCYPGTGAVSATVPLPAIYKGIVNSSYFQDFSAYYQFELLSGPAGAAAPAYTTTDLRSITSTSTVISNLNRIGEYRFRITPVAYNAGVGAFLNQEYACSGQAMADTFVVRLEGLINANAGSDQVLGNTNTANLAGNDPGVATGVWTLVSKPANVTPLITAPGNRFTSVTNMNVAGLYEFAWTITTPYGGCVSTDNVVINITTTLGVKWLNFTAEKNTAGVMLNWATSSEENNKGFEIERSSNGLDWETTGYMASLSLTGNSNQVLNYQFTDHQPVNGINFYRLKQTDLDGRYAYSIVSKVTFDHTGRYQVYPNPVTSTLLVKGLSGKNVVRVLNLNGQVVKVVQTNGETVATIDVSQLPVGMYLVETEGRTGNKEVYKVVKQ